MKLRILTLLSLGVMAGCGPSNKVLDQANVSGAVTFDGKPLDKGQVTFAMAGEPPTVCEVVDGKYAGRAAVGTNMIQIMVMRKVADAGKGSMTPQMVQQMKEMAAKAGNTGYDPTVKNVAPPEWGASSKNSRVVEAGAANNFDFAVKSK